MSSMSGYLRAIWRASLAPTSILTAEEAAEALPGQPDEARKWLQEHVRPLGQVAGETVYRWGDVVAALEATSTAEPVRSGVNGEEPGDLLSTKAAARHLRVRPATLFSMTDRAVRDGIAIATGQGQERQHVRWQSTRIDEWWQGVQP